MALLSGIACLRYRKIGDVFWFRAPRLMLVAAILGYISPWGYFSVAPLWRYRYWSSITVVSISISASYQAMCSFFLPVICLGAAVFWFYAIFPSSPLLSC